MAMRRKRFWWCTGASAALAVSASLVYWAAGSWLVTPRRYPVPPPPASLEVEELTLPGGSGVSLAAWLFLPPRPRGAVLVLHGVHASRRAMLGRAVLLRQAGFAVLAPDLQAHGASGGSQVTFGFLEAKDAAACLTYLEQRFPGLPSAGVGVSMGGAALALSGSRSRLQALVLEAVYPTIREAVDNRIAQRVGPISKILSPLLLLQLRPRLGISPDELRPVEALKKPGCPLFFLAGSADRLTTEAQTRSLYDAAASPKELWLVAGAGHADLLRFDPAGYRNRVLAFLEKHLGSRCR